MAKQDDNPCHSGVLLLVLSHTHEGKALNALESKFVVTGTDKEVRISIFPRPHCGIDSKCGRGKKLRFG